MAYMECMGYIINVTIFVDFLRVPPFSEGNDALQQLMAPGAPRPNEDAPRPPPLPPPPRP